MIVTIAAQAWAGVGRLAEAGESDIFAIMANEVLGSPLDKILIIAVLTSAAASTQTTILPTARTALSMGAKGAHPADVGEGPPDVPDADQRDDLDGHPVGRCSTSALKLVSNDVYQDAIWALGLMIAFYYGITGFASAIYYRHLLLRSVKNFVLMGLAAAGRRPGARLGVHRLRA